MEPKYVSLNIENGGIKEFIPSEAQKDAGDVQPRKEKYGVMKEAVGLMASIGTSIICVQEVDLHNMQLMNLELIKVTNKQWSFSHRPQIYEDKNYSGVGVFFKEPIVQVGDPEVIKLGTLNNSYQLQHCCVVLQLQNGARVAVISGKFVWGEKGQGGLSSDKERLREVDVFTNWIQKKEALWRSNGVMGIVVGVDLNDGYGSPSHKALKRMFHDGNCQKPTAPSHGGDREKPTRRIDYLFYRNLSQDSSNGFTEDIGRSQYFGSDHHFVHSKIQIQ
jgi:exonuclease III